MEVVVACFQSKPFAGCLPGDGQVDPSLQEHLNLGTDIEFIELSEFPDFSEGFCSEEFCESSFDENGTTLSTGKIPIPKLVRVSIICGIA